MRTVYLAGGLVALVVCTTGISAMAGCGTASPVTVQPAKSPEQFLKWSMDQYHGMRAFEADGTVTATSHDVSLGTTQTRAIRYVAPNRFRVVATTSNDFKLTSVSDGNKLVEYAEGKDIQPVAYPAPDGIATVSSLQMSQPMFCGSLLYQFFGGAANLGYLVDAGKGPITYGDEYPADDETARIVKFYGKQTYGHVQVLIGEETGRVYRITYDSDPLLQQMRARGAGKAMDAARHEVEKMVPGADRDKAAKMVAAEDAAPEPDQLVTTEIYSHITTDPTSVSDKFDVTLPKGMDAVEMASSPYDRPPVPIGSPAPDVEVKGMSGRTIRLSSLRGHVVMLDFWATWCPPCKKGLAETARISREGKASGLRVLAISGEEQAPVEAFLKDKPYIVSTYLDPGGSATSAYRADAIPTVAIIDAAGNLSAYFVGLQPRSTLVQALVKAGAQL